MSKEFYDKYGKLVDCFSCNCIEPCSKSDSPLCSEGYVFFAKDKITDLEAKLAESEEQRQHLKNWLDNEILTSIDHESYYATVNEYEEEVKKLKHQLETQENTITNLVEDNRASQEWYKKQLTYKDEEINVYKKYIKEEDLYKISFCVEKLTDIRSFVSDATEIKEPDYTKVCNYIDNQIKAIKEMK